MFYAPIEETCIIVQRCHKVKMSNCALCVQDVVHVCNNCVALMFSQMDCSEGKSSVIICWGRCELKTTGSVVSW